MADAGILLELMIYENIFAFEYLVTGVSLVVRDLIC